MSKEAAPIVFIWDGEALRPASDYWRSRAEKAFAKGERYRMVEHYERSVNTHNHFFACLHEAWQNLPEVYAGKFPTDEHLRKWALVEAGFYDVRELVCTTHEEAQKVAAFIRPLDEYAVIIVNQSTVREYRAKSQSRRAMGAKDFQASKIAVLEIVSNMIGVELQSLAERARVAAPPDRRAG